MQASTCTQENIMPNTGLIEWNMEYNWKGKSSLELSEQEIHEVCREAEQQGETAALDERPTNPYPALYLGGVPCLLWRMGYRRRASKAARVNLMAFA